MGQDIERSEFTEEDFAEFSRRLRDETATLARWFDEGTLDEDHWVGGFELEAWLADQDWAPAPLNGALLERLDDPLLTTELARFNIELNTEPRPLRADALESMELSLADTWRRCRNGAAALGARLLMIGILPTVRQADLTGESMTPIARYAALNEQILRQRDGRALSLDICGRERLHASHPDVMLESAATSFQIHLQTPASRAADYFNASMLVSGPMVAIGANSPYLFGHDLWDETRIPLFEQSVEAGGFAGARQGPPRRVGFGTGFVRESLMECFRENLEHFPVILPMHFDDPDAPPLPHLQLHNGTLWRWNRPLVGMADGVPHVRIEHRVVPGGPSVTDEIANAAFYYGLVRYYASRHGSPPGQLLAFPRVRDNFYACARYGLNARVGWSDGQVHPVGRLLLEHLLPCARVGLREFEIDSAAIDHYLDVIRQRVRSGYNGAGWQRAWVARHGRDMRALTAAYAEHQAGGDPVHTWGLDD
ncbi:MAG: glutamate--cysteine ligase [Halofilum sp. (in: g-proteobacteria)]|nr:glutamate--cysteine ligase [Halofilum sp. (in: g-proteobacteria)]